MREYINIQDFDARERDESINLKYHRREEGPVKWSDRFLRATRTEALLRNHLVLFLDKVELQHVHLDGIPISMDVCGCTGAK
jgi:hypothetical protein